MRLTRHEKFGGSFGIFLKMFAIEKYYWD